MEPRRCVRPVQRRSSTLAARNTPSTCSTVKLGLKGMELMDVKDLISLLSNWIGLLANRTRSLMTLLMSYRWNATFMDYSSHVGEVKEYG